MKPFGGEDGWKSILCVVAAFAVGCAFGSCTTHDAIRDVTTRCYVETYYSKTPDPTWVQICENQEFRLNPKGARP